MGKLYIGTKSGTPVAKGGHEHWGDIQGTLSNQTDLQEALDSKVSSVSVANVLYGTDNNGNPTTYDTSSLFSDETAPQGYTEVEYITSTKEYTDYTYDENPHSELGTMTVTHLETFETKTHNQLSQRSSSVGYEVTKVKFELHLNGDPWWVYFNDQNDDWTQAYTLTDTSVGTMFGLRFDYTGPNQSRAGDGTEITEVENEHHGEQYINTGIVINNYPDGYGELNTEKSEYQDSTLYPQVSRNNYSNVLSICNQMTSRYGIKIRNFKLYADTDAHLQIFAIHTDGTEESSAFNSYTDTTTLLNATGVYVSSMEKVHQGDTLYFDVEDSKSELVTIETEVKANQEFIDAQTSGNYGYVNFLGSAEASGQAGILISASFGDGTGYKHYNAPVSRIDVPYKAGVWNNIKLEPGTLTVNGEIHSLTVDQGNVRCANPDTPIYLFAIYKDYGTLNKIIPGACSLKTTRIYKNDVLVFNGIPCVEDASGRPGMYDTVSNTFLPSEKEGIDFIAGPEVQGKKISLGVDEANVILGLGYDKKIKPFYGTNGIVVNSVYDTDGYEELEYLESTDGQCAIDTGVKFTNESWRAWEVTYALGKTSAGLSSGNTNYCQYIMGDCAFSDIGQSYYRMTIGFYDGRSRFNYSNSSSRCSYVYDYVLEDVGQWHTAFISPNYIYIDGNISATISPAQSLYAHNQNMHLFSAKNVYNGTPQWYGGFVGKISSMRYYYNPTNEGKLDKDRVALADLIPVRRKSDGELGFYDTVNGRFCPNINPNGNLVAGPTKYSTIGLSFDPDSYLKNIAMDQNTSLMITQTTDPSSSNPKTLTGSNNVVLGPYGEITDDGSNSIAINGKVTGSGAIVIGKNSSTSAGYSVVVGNDVEVDGSSSVVVGRSGTSSTSFKVGSYSVILGNEIQTAKSSGVVAIGYHVYAYNGNNLVAIGKGAASYGNLSVSIGYGAQSLNGYGIALGANARINGDYGIAIGNTSSNADENRTLASTSAIAIGSNARAESNSVSIGHLTKANGGNSVNIGTQSTIPYGSTVVIGYGATVSGGDCGVGIGVNSQTSSTGIAIGYNTKSYGNNDIAIGYNSQVNGTNSIVIGKGAINQNSSNSSIAIGEEASIGTGNSYSIAIGCASRVTNSSGTTTDAIAIGETAVASRSDTVAIGKWAQASGLSAVALGSKSVSSAENAIQLGEGTNNTQSTLQFRNYQLVNSSGIIPYERLTPYAPTNGYVLAWSTSTNSLVWVENGEGGGSYELPIASASTLGGVKIGEGLQINPNTGVLSVVEQPGGGGEGVWGQIEGNIEDQTDLMNILNSKFTQTLEMPKASNAYNGKTLQFLGITDLLYTHGYVYECQYKRISSLTGNTSDSTRFTVTFDAPRFEAYFKEYHPEIDLSDNTNYFIQYVSSTNKWTFYIDGEGDIGIYFDTYNLPYVGINVSYIGQNEPEEEDQVNMVYYPASDEEHAPFGYIWNRLNVQPHVEVIDNVTSSSTTDALSANQGRVLQEQIDRVSVKGRFLAIWDCDTHNARYLTDGFEYERSDYFIVGAANPETPELELVSQTSSTATYELYDGDVGSEFRYWFMTYHPDHEEPESGDYTITFRDQDFVNVTGLPVQPAGQNGYPREDFQITTSSGTPSAGDTVVLHYTTNVNYKPKGSEYNTSGDYYEKCVDEVPQVSDMYFYDGTNWILLANHSKAIAIDHDLSTSSTNPVENATVTNALNSKVSKTSEANRVYGTTSLGEQIALELDEGLEIEDGKLKNTKTSGEWGAISGTLSDQTDLQNALDGKQHVLTAGNNITITEDQETGETIISSRGGGSGMGTIAITDIFTRPGYVEDQNHDSYRHKAWFHGNYENILFTTNADYDYLKANKEDLYVTISQRKHHGGKRRFNVCNDDRVKTNMKLHCWRIFTNKRWNFDYLGWETDFIPNLDAQQYEENGSQISDLNYVYFYTKEDYDDDPDTMVSANPVVYFAVTRIDPYDEQERPDNDLPTTFAETYENGGNWGTSFNEIYCEGDHLRDYKIFGGKGYKKFERISDYDITEFINSCSNSWGRPSEELGMDKMKGRSYELNGNKYYFWCNDWTDSGEDVFAHLDDNDDPIPNSVPEDKSLISSFTTVGDLDDYTLIEERPDLRWYRYNPSYSESDLQNFCTYAHGVQIDVDPYEDKLDYRYGSLYKYDYPIQPRRISQCKILMTDKAPWSKVWDEDEGTWVYPADKYNDYLNRAYTIDEIESNEDLRYLIAYQKRIILVFPYTTAHFWMRSFGWQSETYRRMQMEIKRQSYYWESTEWGGQWTCDNYDEGGNPVVEDYTLQAMPEDRHSLAAYFWKCWCLGDHSYSVYDEDSGESVDINYECFRYLLEFIGNRDYSPRWNPNDMNKVYWMPVQFNICTGRDVSYNLKSQSTPVDKKMTITGSRHSSGYAGINGISQNVIS